MCRSICVYCSKKGKLKHTVMIVGLSLARNSFVRSGINCFQYRLSATIFIAICVDSAYTFTQTYATWTMSVILVFVGYVCKKCLIIMSLFRWNPTSLLGRKWIQTITKSKIIKKTASNHNSLLTSPINLNKMHSSS